MSRELMELVLPRLAQRLNRQLRRYKAGQMDDATFSHRFEVLLQQQHAWLANRGFPELDAALAVHGAVLVLSGPGLRKPRKNPSPWRSSNTGPCALPRQTSPSNTASASVGRRNASAPWWPTTPSEQGTAQTASSLTYFPPSHTSFPSFAYLGFIVQSHPTGRPSRLFLIRRPWCLMRMSPGGNTCLSTNLSFMEGKRSASQKTEKTLLRANGRSGPIVPRSTL